MNIRFNFITVLLVVLTISFAMPDTITANEPSANYTAVKKSGDQSSMPAYGVGYENKHNVQGTLGFAPEQIGATGRWLLLTSLSLMVIIVFAKLKMVMTMMKEEDRHRRG